MEDRTTPAVYAVGMLSPATGDAGESAATFTGGIELNSTLPVQDGKAVVTAANPTAAIQAALVNTVTATVGGQSATYQPGPTTVTTTTTAQLPFVVTTSTTGEYVLHLEDLSNMPGSNPDWDYNDRTWTVTVVELTTISVATPTPGEESADGSRPVVVELTRANGNAGSLDQPLYLPFTLTGTATPGVDYTPPSAFIAVFWPGEATTKIVLPALPDTVIEGPETIIVHIDPPIGVAPPPIDTTITITDPGTLPPIPPVPPAPTLPEVWVSGSLDGEERPDGLRPVVFQLSRTNPSNPATAPALTVGFSMSGTAGSDADYFSPGVYSASFAPGQLTTTVALEVIDDLRMEGSESLILTLLSSTAYTLGTNPEVASLLDDDIPLPPPPNTPPTEEIAFEAVHTDAALQGIGALPKPQTKLQVSKWRDAFELYEDIGNFDDLAVRARALDSWVYSDPDGYRIRYVEPNADTNDAQKNNPNAIDSRTLTLWTTRAGVVEEVEREMTFVETGNKTGVFRSRPFVLVADQRDDVWDHTGQGNHEANLDNSPDDPTLLVALGDKVHVKRGSFAVNADVPARAEINVRIYNLRPPLQPGNPNPAPPLFSETAVANQVAHLKSMYAQLGVRVNVVVESHLPPSWTPTGAANPVTFDPTALYDSEAADNSLEFDMQKGLVTHLRAPDPANGPKYIHVYLVRRVLDLVGRAYQIGPTDLSRGETFRNTIVMGHDFRDGNVQVDPEVRTLAHEVGHILGLHHTSGKFAADPTLTATERLESRTRVMGTGEHSVVDQYNYAPVIGQKRFSLSEGSRAAGVFNPANEKAKILKAVQ